MNRPTLGTILALAALIAACLGCWGLLYNWQETTCKHSGGTFITVGGRPGCVYLPKQSK